MQLSQVPVPGPAGFREGCVGQGLLEEGGPPSPVCVWSAMFLAPRRFSTHNELITKAFMLYIVTKINI